MRMRDAPRGARESVAGTDHDVRWRFFRRIDSSAVTGDDGAGSDVKSFQWALRSLFDESGMRGPWRATRDRNRDCTLDQTCCSIDTEAPVTSDEPLGDASIIPTYLLSAFTGARPRSRSAATAR